MPDFKIKQISSLLADIRFSPIRVKLDMIDRAESLLMLVDSDVAYPFEFICAKITGYNPGDDADIVMVKGVDIVADLRLFLLKLSQSVDQPTAMVGQNVYSISELAKQLNVSDKTIRRWKVDKLITRYFIFPDGVKKVGITQKSYDYFASKHPNLIQKASEFSRLKKEEKDEIIDLCRELKKENPSIKRQQAIKEISHRTGRSLETVRYTIQNLETQNPNILNLPLTSIVNSKTQDSIADLYQANVRVSEIMQIFGCSRSSVYRAINRQREKNILLEEFTFIDSSDFANEEALQKIVDTKIEMPNLLDIEIMPEDVNVYMRKLNRLNQFNRDQEVRMFRLYNAAKKLFMLKKTTSCGHVSGELLSELETLLQKIKFTQSVLIQSNLRVVVNVAVKHLGREIPFAELISDGNVALMRAVEGYDFKKGFRFATYAGWAVVRSFAKITTEQTFPLDDAMHKDMRHIDFKTVPVIEEAGRDLDLVISANLDDREQYVIRSHYGLDNETLIRREKKTLKQIGEELSLSKEAVRQIELKALQKLRHCISEDMFESLLR